MKKACWEWNKHSFMKYVNENGMKLLSNPEYDINLDDFVTKITKMKFELFYNYSKGRQVE